MSNIENTITYHGDNVELALTNHPEVVRVVEKLSSELTGANIKVHVMTPTRANEPLEWTFSSTSSLGRRTLDLKQRVPGGSVTITNSFK